MVTAPTAKAGPPPTTFWSLGLFSHFLAEYNFRSRFSKLLREEYYSQPKGNDHANKFLCKLLSCFVSQMDERETLNRHDLKNTEFCLWLVSAKILALF